jgi:hypothetical protein
MMPSIVEIYPQYYSTNKAKTDNPIMKTRTPLAAMVNSMPLNCGMIGLCFDSNTLMYFISESEDELHNFINNNIQGFQPLRSHGIEPKASTDCTRFYYAPVTAHFLWLRDDPAQGIYTQDPSLFLFIRK